MGAVAEFFAGIGLVRRAVETARRPRRIAFANDNDPAKARLYRALRRDEPDVFDPRDIAELSAADIPPCGMWTASFPCTDLSLAGGRLGIRAPQSGAVWHVLRLLSETPPDERPGTLVFENVMGLVSSRGGADFHALVGGLNDLGYAVDPMRVDAAHFTPQSRPRLFLIADPIDADADAPADPFALAPTETRPARLLAAMRAGGDLIWRARHLPPLPSKTTTLADIVEPIPDDSPLWWSGKRVEYFRQQIHPNHATLIERWRREEQTRYATAFRRIRAFDGVKRSVAEVRTDGLAGCLRTPKGGSAKQILVEVGFGHLRVRHLTPTECMRLQGFEAEVPPGATAGEMLFALGDAVCVPAVRWVLDQADAPATIAALDDEPSRSAPASSIRAASS